ncbi:TRAP transporter, DctM subunit [Desulfuromonas soudanensis]|uniref:TRAP transporter, DctM subunit n=1 Tax=Desulfuromonas soudanensis TaxID=1603606 RepID=A0A0M4CUJ0_9BACT|nr:TRAP transporter large permease [Desulfuromonas soudanensis]ALC15191.1 TRAP transporter, DctM subunit [Desulfuromonas soudanensis]
MGVFEQGLLYAATTLILLFSGMPIAFALGGVAVAFMLIFMPAMNIQMIPEILFSELDNFTLLAIPLFILMGAAIGKTRAAEDLYGSAHRWMYKLPGGLGVANVIGCSVFAAMCGSSPATCAAIGGMGIPEMRKRGYSSGLASGLIAAGGTLGILIPPSVTLIIYGVIVEVSIGQLFIAGIIPGVLLTLFFGFYVIYAIQKEKKFALTSDEGSISRELLQEESFTWKQRWETLPRLAPFLILIVLVMVAMYGGFATPSEVAGVGALAALVMVVAIYGVYRWEDIKVILSGTARESCMIMVIIAMAFLFTYVMSYLHITQSAAEWMVSLDMSKWVFLFWVNILLLVLGFFLPPVAIILMVTPVIMPGILAHGFDPIWFGIMLTINMELGLITPPVGLNLFVINGIAPDITFKEITWGVLPFIIIMGLFIVVLAVFPDVAMWLPKLLYKGG